MNLDLSPRVTTFVLAVWAVLLLVFDSAFNGDRWLGPLLAGLALISALLGRRVLTRSQPDSDLMGASLFLAAGLAAAVAGNGVITVMGLVLGLVFLVASRRHAIYQALDR